MILKRNYLLYKYHHFLVASVCVYFRLGHMIYNRISMKENNMFCILFLKNWRQSVQSLVRKIFYMHTTVQYTINLNFVAIAFCYTVVPGHAKQDGINDLLESVNNNFSYFLFWGQLGFILCKFKFSHL